MGNICEANIGLPYDKGDDNKHDTGDSRFCKSANEMRSDISLETS
jgi:hypothetical protein